MNQQTSRIINIIKSIPEGKVLSYGSVAAIAGNPRAARQVSWVLRVYTDKLNLPWHRVVSSKGYISIKDAHGYALQKQLLESEGLFFDKNDHIDFKIYLWNGDI